ncbi:hypothetical protein EI94DRAFT_1810685 [Lactarius quietus]|nr:hypothetical protein EI94DRAFT_1810685 [Lactarius quietus]
MTTGCRVDPEVQATPAKRACIAGPVHGCPMQLEVVRNGEESWPSSDRAGPAAASNLQKGMQRGLQRDSSFYPGYGGAASLLNPEAAEFLKPTYEEPPAENEDDWIDDRDMTSLAQGPPSKMVERPLWEPDTSAREPHPRDLEHRDLTASSQCSSGSGATLQPITKSIVTSAALSTSNTAKDVVTGPSTWPPSTDLMLVKSAKGTTQMMLTIQHPVIRKVISDSFEGLRASLLFENAFPDSVLTVSFIWEALIASATVYGPAAADMQTRVAIDIEYLNKIVPVPHARMSHFHAEVKESYSALIFPILTAMVLPTAIASFIQDQLSNYNYTFPKAPKYLFWNIEDDGATVYKVPILMVALVATAMYATLYEWCTGNQHQAEFSANTYLDVYKGHVNMLQLIKDRRYAAFHTTMVEIYSKASSVPENSGDIGAPVADLVLSNLDE